MRHGTTSSSRCFLLMTLLVAGVLSGCSSSEAPHASRSGALTEQGYNYPIRPGTPEWRSLSTYAEKNAAVQVPEQTLESMSTPELVETCLKYPMLREMMAYNDWQTGFEQQIAKFNGLRELMKRQDAGRILLARYQQMNPLAFDPTVSDADLGDFAFTFRDIEMTLAQQPILQSLTKEERRTLVSEGVKKARLMASAQPDIHAILGKMVVAYMTGRALRVDYPAALETTASNQERVVAFLDHARWSLPDDADFILKAAEHITASSPSQKK